MAGMREGKARRKEEGGRQKEKGMTVQLPAGE
jgi:hypothetical protein